MIWYFTMTDKAEDFMVSVTEEVADRQMEKILKKTADKQKDVRYNSGRTKSNAALSIRGGSLWVLPANTK